MKVLSVILASTILALIPQVLVYALIWDFENAAQLNDWTVINGEWTIEDGKLRGELLDAYIGIVAGDLEWDDYTLETETTVVEGKYTYWMVRVQDDPLSYYTLERNDGNKAPIWRRDEGQHSKIAEDVALPDGHLESHIWTIEVEGESIIAYVDGEEILSAEDNTYEKGKIGLGGHNYASDTGLNIILFDYVKVEGPNIPASAVDSSGKLTAAWGSLKVGY